jgi:hypothetical protein
VNWLTRFSTPLGRGQSHTQATFDAFAARMTPVVENLSANYLPAETPLKLTSG